MIVVPIPPETNMRALTSLLLLLTVAIAHAGPLPLTPAPAGAKVYFISPDADATVASPVTVRFGLSGIGVAPAGVVKENTGHHHLLVDVAELPAMDQPLPKDATHLHFGGGQTEATIELAPGKHTLQLVLGDTNHIPHDPPIVSEKITIEVK
jgi:hypothetical protein